MSRGETLVLLVSFLKHLKREEREDEFVKECPSVEEILATVEEVRGNRFKIHLILEILEMVLYRGSVEVVEFIFETIGVLSTQDSFLINQSLTALKFQFDNNVKSFIGYLNRYFTWNFEPHNESLIIKQSKILKSLMFKNHQNPFLIFEDQHKC
eukprot:TRINITY_DN26866_c0_g1_i1.p1 TRINITY_DN26866_c0_g1~~TRINITY_DN26866_c0_g1_i1.p1  ORF type:complete len:154 (+),score=29.28 TRINITY_DN26866_c0_g1_i1:131-592(+)